MKDQVMDRALDKLLDELRRQLANYEHMNQQNRMDKINASSGSLAYVDGAVAASKLAVELVERLTIQYRLNLC